MAKATKEEAKYWCDSTHMRYVGVIKILMAVVLALVALGYLDFKLALWFFAVVLAVKGLKCLVRPC